MHPQSIIHSIVEFEDSSLKAQMGLPDMKVPIQYALSYPNRMKAEFQKFSFMKYPVFTFEQPDLETFRNLSLAYSALNKGGNMPCILNAANEIVVESFLRGNVGFLQMPDVIEQVMNKMNFVGKPGIEDLKITDSETRIYTSEIIKSIN